MHQPVPSDETWLGVDLTPDELSQFKLPKGYMVVLSGELASPMGFGSEKKVFLSCGTHTNWVIEVARMRVFITEKNLIKSPFTVKANRLVSDLYLHKDIMERQRVGDALVPLLRIVTDTSTRLGEIVRADFRQIHYIPLRTGSFVSIAIEVTDTFGRPMHFLFGDISVKLHFCQKKSPQRSERHHLR